MKSCLFVTIYKYFIIMIWKALWFLKGALSVWLMDVLLWAERLQLIGLCVFSEPLLAGLPQMVKFTLLTGHYTVKKGDALQLSNAETLPILPSTSCTARISSPTAGQWLHVFICRVRLSLCICFILSEGQRLSSDPSFNTTDICTPTST